MAVGVRVVINKQKLQLIRNMHSFPSTLAGAKKSIQPTKKSSINKLLIEPSINNLLIGRKTVGWIPFSELAKVLGKECMPAY